MLGWATFSYSGPTDQSFTTKIHNPKPRNSIHSNTNQRNAETNHSAAIHTHIQKSTFQHGVRTILSQRLVDRAVENRWPWPSVNLSIIS